MASRKKLKPSKENIFALSDFFYYLRRSRKLKKRKIRYGERGVRESRNIIPDGKNARKRGLRLRKTRKKKKPGIKHERFVSQQGLVHQGPRYNISFHEVRETYQRTRKGRCFYPSKKTLWKNRHALVLGCSNFYRKAKDDAVSNFKGDNTEYDTV